jgi:hypothetical protein
MCPPQNGQYGCDTHHPLCSGHSFSTRACPGWHFVWEKERPPGLAQSSTQVHVPDMRFFVTVNIGHEPTTHNFGWCPGAQIHPTWPSGFNLSITRACPGYPGTPGDIHWGLRNNEVKGLIFQMLHSKNKPLIYLTNCHLPNGSNIRRNFACQVLD